jgi:adenosine deaminase
MSIENYIFAMPKAELNVYLEGAVRNSTWMMIAEQNEIPAESKEYNAWVQSLDDPDYGQLDELVQGITEWLRYPEDLTRLVYDLGVSLSKQNVKYAEVSVNVALFMQASLTFDEFLSALNDGRDRAERGWGIRIRWILTVPRSQPRQADEILRWATSATGKRGGVVAFGLIGDEDAQPVGQFERAFNAAQKKDVPRVVQAGTARGAEGVLEALQQLNASRIVDGWGVADAPDAIKMLDEQDIPLVVSMGRALCHGWVKEYKAYPLQHLFDQNIKLVISADMPNLYKTELSDEYLAAVEHCGLSLEELDELAINALRVSYLPEEDKAAMIADFKKAYNQLRAEHIGEDEDTTE